MHKKFHFCFSTENVLYIFNRNVCFKQINGVNIKAPSNQFDCRVSLVEPQSHNNKKNDANTIEAIGINLEQKVIVQ